MNLSRQTDAIAQLHALVAARAVAAADEAGERASTRASLESQISSAALLSLERLYTERFGMARGIPYVQYLRTFVRKCYDVGEDAAMEAFRYDLLRAQANAEPAEWAF